MLATHPVLFALVLLVLCLLAVLTRPAHFAATPFNVRRKRKQTDPSNSPTPLDMAVTLTANANKLRVTMAAPYSLNGLPHFGATGGAHVGTEYPTAATVVSSTVVDLTYAHNVAAANVITIPSHDPALRFKNGAYVAAQVATLA
jgi:hypothetical protein